MSSRKAIYFTLAGLNSVACAYFFNYLFFLLKQHFGFGDRENLLISALHGFVYVFAAWQGGRFAERRGFLTSLKIGFAGMALVLITGSFLQSVAGQVATIVCWTVAMLFTWPALEALVSHGEDDAGLQRRVGTYNCVWAASSAVAYFSGGAIFERFGQRSIYWLPAGIYLTQLGIVAWLARHRATGEIPAKKTVSPVPHTPEPAAFQQPVNPRAFLKMAWLANPFAYIAINSVLPVIPHVAEKLHLTVTQSGLFCSLWFFTRLATFAFLWRWTKWHYKFRWLATAFVLLIGGYATLLLAEKLWLLVLAQLAFGAATGLIYYSSLFYSMDIGETKGEHGGFHEAAIGAGICIGPAVGALALFLAPSQSHAGAWAVSALLVGGLATLAWMRLRAAKPA